MKQRGCSRSFVFGLLIVFTSSVYPVLLDPPGSDERSKKLRQDLRTRYLENKDTYPLRTRHIGEDGMPKYTNRLVSEDSPYLLQHAHNPVDWHPWGPAAFDLARAQNKPVFLSIGYSTCHWCHVMERESFDDEAIAKLLNENFISIKVDREQRPDLDDIYMTGVQLMTGRGGWPMSNFLTVEGKPFFAGTYFPPDKFTDLLNQISQVWVSRRDDLLEQAEKVSNAINQITSAQSKASEINHSVVISGVKALIASHDPVHGGFGQAIKFPQESNLLLLLNAWQRDGDKLALDAAIKSLDGMAAGGIFDQVGGGFHRYSTDRQWLVPHFEKMLYNQAQLARVYSKAYEVTQKESYRRVVEQTLDYVLRDMRSDTGGFYSARDADSEDEEGLFYLWTKKQMASVLSDDELLLAQNLFGITDSGNFEGSNIPTLHDSLETYATKHGLVLARLISDIALIRDKLMRERESRIHPLRDEKIITAWNGMMISAFVIAARDLGREDYLQAAILAGDVIWSGSWSQEQLRRIILNGHASITAGLEDYAYLVESYLYLFDATADDVWLSRAVRLTDTMLLNYWDDKDGGFFLAQVNLDEPSIARPKSPTDGAIASGNSVALNLLVRLFERTGVQRYRRQAIETINAFSGLIQESPARFTYMLLAVDDFHEGSVESIQFSSDGHVKAVVSVNDSSGFEITLSISPGWHINAHDVNQTDLIPTRIESQNDNWKMGKINYPAGIQRTLGFQEKPLNLYEDSIEISGLLEQSGTAALCLVLSLQACDDEICLPPEQLNFVFPGAVD